MHHFAVSSAMHDHACTQKPDTRYDALDHPACIEFKSIALIGPSMSPRIMACVTGAEGTGAMTAAEFSILIWAIPSLILVPILLRFPRRGDER